MSSENSEAENYSIKRAAWIEASAETVSISDRRETRPPFLKRKAFVFPWNAVNRRTARWRWRGRHHIGKIKLRVLS